MKAENLEERGGPGMVGNLLKDKPFWERCALLLLKNFISREIFPSFSEEFRFGDLELYPVVSFL